MIIENEMIHGSLPRSAGIRRQPRSRSVWSARRSLQRPSPHMPPGQQGWGEWDTGPRIFNEMQERLRQAGKTYRPPCRTRIEDDTPIVPRAVAMFVCEEASVWLGEPFPRAWEAELAERANVVYQHHARFRHLLRKRGNAGRDGLIAFMRHWLSALLASRRPGLHQRLPAAYANGQELPLPLAPTTTALHEIHRRIG